MDTESFLASTFSFVDDEKQFAGSSCPGANTALSVDLEWLRRTHDIGVIVSLNESSIDGAAVERAGMRHLALCVADYRAPSMDQLQQLEDFLGVPLPTRRVLFHCNAGMGRTGTLLACMLVRHRGLSAAEAIAHVRAARRGSVQTYKQEDGVKQYAASLAPP